jgi:glycosyltransferase involved in cell wall biosynthesis
LPPGKPFRVLHLISTLDVGGAEQTLYRLVTGMNGSSFSNMVVALTSMGHTGNMIREAGITACSLDMKKGVPNPRGLFSLARIMNEYRPHIIQGWMYHANLMALFFRNKGQVIWNIRCSDMDLASYGPLYRFTVRAGSLFSRFPDSIITNSCAGRSYHEGIGYAPKAWEVIPNGFDTTLFQPDQATGQEIRAPLDISGDAPVIGLIARFDPMKDHGTFLAAARLLLRSHPAAHFLLAGKGVSRENPYLRFLAEQTEQPSRIHLLEERKDISRILNALDIASSSSISEGLPNAVGEAMATGIPCVVTDAGDSAVLVGETGIVVPKKDPQALCSAWQRLLDAGPDYRKAMGERARKRIMDHYSLPSMICRYDTLYRNLIGDRTY